MVRWYGDGSFAGGGVTIQPNAIIEQIIDGRERIFKNKKKFEEI